MNPLPLTACLIVRDEQDALPRCLDSLAGVVSQIVVVDTGSIDRTRDIAREHGAVLATHPWNEDFAAARNASLDLAQQPWILVIDADEELDRSTLPALREVLERPELGYLVRMRLLEAEGGHTDVPLPRLFRNDRRLRFRRRIHETILDSLWESGLTQPPQAEVRILHHGYARETVEGRGKLERNLRIHRRMREAGESDAYDLFKHAQALCRAGDLAERRAVLGEAWERFAQAPEPLRRQWPWAGKLRALHGQDLSEQGFLSRAAAVLELQGDEAACAELPLARLAWAWRTGDWRTAERDAAHAARQGHPAAALEARTRQAWTAGDHAALETVAASHGIEAAVWLALLELESGKGEQGMARLGRPMAIAPHEDCVRLASGIFLAHYGDFPSAVSLFASVEGVALPLARCWLLVSRRRAGEDVARLLAELGSPAHHEEAALALELARRLSIDFAPDTAFNPELLERRRKVWERALDLP